MNGLITAINAYESTYGRMPTSTAAYNSLTTGTGCPDFTFGTVKTGSTTVVLPTQNNLVPGGLPLIENLGNAGNYQANNSEVMTILMDHTASPDGTQIVNANHIKNPQQIKFFEGHPSADVPGQPNYNPGIGNDDVYRDPWGDPYIITLDMNNDGRCRDAFYRNQNISQSIPNNPVGFFGLNNNVDAGGNGDDYEVPQTMIIWSLGLYGHADSTKNANTYPNNYHVLSW